MDFLASCELLDLGDEVYVFSETDLRRYFNLFSNQAVAEDVMHLVVRSTRYHQSRQRVEDQPQVQSVRNEMLVASPTDAADAAEDHAFQRELSNVQALRPSEVDGDIDRPPVDHNANIINTSFFRICVHSLAMPIGQHLKIGSS